MLSECSPSEWQKKKYILFNGRLIKYSALGYNQTQLYLNTTDFQSEMFIRNERRLFTYITATVHLFEFFQVGLKGSQVLLFHIAEEVLDGYSGHLYRCGGVHDCSLAP